MPARERLVWLEIKQEQESHSETRKASAEDIRARKCPQCGWLDKPDEVQCFRCGYQFTGGQAYRDLLAGEGVEVPPIEVKVDTGFRDLIGKNRRDPLEAVRLRLAGERHHLVQGFEHLLSLDEIDIIRYDHQLDTARRALNDMRGQALLADEVGLGKTIEAGLILKELVVRGLAKRVLVLTPASLVMQWREELFNKFGENLHIARTVDDWDAAKVVGSLSLAKRPEHADRILLNRYDLLIVDEAHHLKSRSSVGHKFVNQIPKKYVLLLTATPVHNNLTELYSLITILKPGLLGTVRAFKRHFISDTDVRQATNPGHLKALLSEVMIRNRRRSVGIKLPPRRAAVYHLEFAEREQILYDAVTDYVKYAFKHEVEDYQHMLSLMTLQRELCSSPIATRGTLAKMSQRRAYPDKTRSQLKAFVDYCDQIDRPRKLDALLEILQRFPDRMIVFTEFVATLNYLRAQVKQTGRPVVTFHGGMSVTQRRKAIASFAATEGSIMISTQAGGEGLNFQFCHQIVNYDLPWNPMRVEQRIGRVHRLGQQHEVSIFNLSVKGTVEERVLDLLVNKIRMFEVVIGELDLILGAMDTDKAFDQLIAEIYIKAKTDEDVTQGFEDLGRRISEARTDYERVKDTESILSDIAEI